MEKVIQESDLLLTKCHLPTNQIRVFPYVCYGSNRYSPIRNRSPEMSAETKIANNDKQLFYSLGLNNLLYIIFLCKLQYVPILKLTVYLFKRY